MQENCTSFHQGHARDFVRALCLTKRSQFASHQRSVEDDNKTTVTQNPRTGLWNELFLFPRNGYAESLLSASLLPFKALLRLFCFRSNAVQWRPSTCGKSRSSF